MRVGCYFKFAWHPWHERALNASFNTQCLVLATSVIWIADTLYINVLKMIGALRCPRCSPVAHSTGERDIFREARHF